ncbi:bifunctional adenosylcobinamide kinase/adenosylcobinamide-phosphate guanylyltransferase [Halodurantibacterium flavum]|uniref:Bifunctional adenosylcobalamin biosynthesis protein n=1 Tax=Halodurantibacterium flavum TaxID=1382802 RepID=A0ABW4S8M5_9RHOB
MSWPQLCVITGGARCGKSSFAERLVGHSGRDRVYLATAQAFDDEMRDRIAAHLAQRGAGWRTIEAPDDPAAHLATAGTNEIVLLDCATLWLSNRMLRDADLAAETEFLMAALRNCAAPVVVVTNEVGMGIVPENALARRFRDAQGRLNQRLAGAADLAVLVVAGLPLVLRGALPDGFRG